MAGSETILPLALHDGSLVRSGRPKPALGDLFPWAQERPNRAVIIRHISVTFGATVLSIEDITLSCPI